MRCRAQPAPDPEPVSRSPTRTGGLYARFRPCHKCILPSPTVETAAQADSATDATDADLAVTGCAMTPRRHLGELARLLREAAGLKRPELAAEIGVVEMTLRNFEAGRHLPTAATLNALLAHPAMARLVEMAQEEGIAVQLRPDPPADVEVVAILIRRRR